MVETWVRRIEAGEATIDDEKLVKKPSIRAKVIQRLIEDGWIEEEVSV